MDTFEELLDLRMKAQLAQQEDYDKEISKVLTFKVAEQTYAIEIEYVTEIIEIPHITVVPAVPEYIKGIINVRSKIVPVMNMRTRFNKPETAYTDRTCVIIVNALDMTVGLIADSVSDVLPVRESNMSATPDAMNVNADKFIKYIVETEDGVNLVLDVERLLGDRTPEPLV
ncbi:MAG: purine-binding chemotaxis protein CheW [Eubacterium sp.]|nr:purine-binding chemotaxis protein CheW [Eubacterium sp.]